MEKRQLEHVHFQERERLKSDLDLQRELDALKRERQMCKDEAKLKVSTVYSYQLEIRQGSK